MKILFYTFRTFPGELLPADMQNLFRFGKLHKSLAEFEQLIATTKPNLIIGFSLSRTSRQETVAINRFNSGIIDKNGPMFTKLACLKGSPFPNSKELTQTFCNWTMYNLSKKHKVAFYHIQEKDVLEFFSWTTQLIS